MRHYPAIFATCCALLAAPSAAQEDDSWINLVSPENGGHVVSVSSESRKGARRLLTDGDHGADSSFSFMEKAPLPQAVTFAFANNQAGRLRRLILYEPRDAGDAKRDFIRAFEIHASRVGSTTGFEKCGEFDCRPEEGFPQAFDLDGRAARFVRIVVTDAATGSGGTIGEIELWGSPVSPKEDIFTDAEDFALFRTTLDRSKGVVELSITPLEKRLLDDARDFRLNEHLLIDALLIAGGANTEADVERFRNIVGRFSEKLRTSGALAFGLPHAKARTLFEAMHRDLLSTYTSQLGDIRQALDGGEYNCVTASALFLCLGEGFGLNLSAEDVSGHVLTRLNGGGESFYIETTTPDWFRKTTTERHAASCDMGGRDPARRRQLTRLGLVALMYYNRGTLFLDKGLYREAIAANFKAACLDPGSPEALDNLLCAYTKLALHLGRQKRYDEALSAISRAREFEPYRLSLQVAQRVIKDERNAGIRDNETNP